MWFPMLLFLLLLLLSFFFHKKIIRLTLKSWMDNIKRSPYWHPHQFGMRKLYYYGKTFKKCIFSSKTNEKIKCSSVWPFLIIFSYFLIFAWCITLIQLVVITMSPIVYCAYAPKCFFACCTCCIGVSMK